MNMEFLSGFLIGFVIVIGILMLVVYAIHGKNDEPCKFDERQLLVRGTAFKMGFFSLIFYNFIYGMLVVACDVDFIDHTTALFVGIFISTCIFACYCIWNDAYVALNRSPKRFMLLFAVLGIINLVAGIAGIIEGKVFHDGMLDYRSINLFVGAIFVILFITYLLKKVIKDKED